MEVSISHMVILILMVLKKSDSCFNDTSAVQNNKYMEHQVFRRLRSISLYACASECIMSSACLSFAFEPLTQMCLLNRNSSADVDVVPHPSLIFSDIERWPKSLSGGCAVLSCPLASRCEVDRLGSATCVPEFQGCGQPPEVTGASVNFDGQSEGDVASYTCGQNFKVCHDVSTSTCQSSGQWENITGLCGQMKVVNPVLLKPYSVPCRPSSNFSVRVVGEPTKDTRWSFSLMAEDDILIAVEFRINIFGHVDTLTMSSRFNGVWQSTVFIRDVRTNLGQEYEVQVTLDNGIYNVALDGTSMYNFTERVAGAQPATIHVDHDGYFHVIEFLYS
ncbi:uncharacterized protein LOC124252861 [Haliotis rubra]|uniref:uncharacterized protein LOC124252861 n=1 Tax=Haliotis rubra TaxID=36100 RepID=UPI001EE5FC66|nr:uncharacterized protein LOC124252861 [Haliotis rubra]